MQHNVSVVECQNMSKEDEDIQAARKQYYDKESAQFFEGLKGVNELADELIPLSNVSPEKVKPIFEKYRKKLESLANEEAPPFPKELEGE